MKKFLIIFFLKFFIITTSWSDDIRDLSIEGISIGESALQFYNANKIESSKKRSPYKDDSFYEVEFLGKDKYETIGIVFKKGDKKYIVYSVRGWNLVDYKKCIEEKKSVVKEIKTGLKILNEKNYRNNFGNTFGKSFAMITDLEVEGGIVRVWCDNFDKNHKVAKKWDDAINIDLSTNEFLDWLDNKAYQ